MSTANGFDQSIQVRAIPGHREPTVYRLTIGAEPIGPVLVDRHTAEVIREWLDNARHDIRSTIIRRKIDLTFHQAIGVGWPPRVASIAPALELKALPAPLLSPPSEVL